jgi:DNA-binding transcriptional MocR family regulator
VADLRSDFAYAHDHLLIAGPAGDCGVALAAEALRRGASVATPVDLTDAIAAARSAKILSIILFAEPRLTDTLYAIQQFRKVAGPQLRITLVIAPEQLAANTAALAEADETMLASMNARRMADTLGIGGRSRTLFADDDAVIELRLAA